MDGAIGSDHKIVMSFFIGFQINAEHSPAFADELIDHGFAELAIASDNKCSLFHFMIGLV